VRRPIIPEYLSAFRRRSRSQSLCGGHPYCIAGSRSIIEVIGTRDTTDVFHPAPLQHRRDPRGTHVFLVLLLKTDHAIRRPFRRSRHPSTIGIIGARGTADVFHPAPFGVADVLDAFDIRD